MSLIIFRIEGKKHDRWSTREAWNVAGFNHNYQRVEGAPSVCRKLATVCNRSSERFRRSCTCVSKKAFSKLEVVLAKADGVASLLLGNAVCHFAVEVDGLLGLLVPGLPWLDSFSSPFCFSLDFGVDLIFSAWMKWAILPCIAFHLPDGAVFSGLCMLKLRLCCCNVAIINGSFKCRNGQFIPSGNIGSAIVWWWECWWWCWYVNTLRWSRLSSVSFGSRFTVLRVFCVLRFRKRVLGPVKLGSFSLKEADLGRKSSAPILSSELIDWASGK